MGPLAQSGIKFEYLSVVTTTWGEWRRRHPDTLVLSMDTGHQRDYSEGAAYRDYFSTDALMFNVPKRDPRLKNKDEILAVVLREHPDHPVALSAELLRSNPVYHGSVEGARFVVLTDESGANRLYQAGRIEIEEWDGGGTAIDTAGGLWTVSEDALVSESGGELLRLPAYRAFWFGWFAAYPHTRLVVR